MLPSASLPVGGAELGLGTSNVLRVPWEVGLVAVDGEEEAFSSAPEALVHVPSLS